MALLLAKIRVADPLRLVGGTRFPRCAGDAGSQLVRDQPIKELNQISGLDIDSALESAVASVNGRDADNPSNPRRSGPGGTEVLLPVRAPTDWRSRSKLEVDFVFADVAVEVKAARAVGGRHLKGLRALAEEKLLARHILVSMDPYPRVVDGILLLPWEQFLDRLWDGKLAGAA